MSQQINCRECGQSLNLKIDAAGYAYETKAGRDDKPRARFDEKGKPVKAKPIPPLFHLSDRRTVTVKREVEKGVTEDVTTEEPVTRTCRCGCINNIY